MKKKLLLFMFPVLGVMLFFALSAHATLIESGLPGGGQPDLLKPGDTIAYTPAQYIRYLYLFVMGFVGIAGLVTLVIWGTVWTASGVIDKKAMAMDGIKNTLIGIGIALSAFVLLNTINPDLTIIKTPTLDPITLKTKTNQTGCAVGVTDATVCKWVDTGASQTPTKACSSWNKNAKWDGSITVDKRCSTRPNFIDISCCYVPK